MIWKQLTTMTKLRGYEIGMHDITHDCSVINNARGNTFSEITCRVLEHNSLVTRASVGTPESEISSRFSRQKGVMVPGVPCVNQGELSNLIESRISLETLILRNHTGKTGFLMWISSYCIACIYQQNTTAKQLFSLLTYEESHSPVECDQTRNQLPRPPDRSGIIIIKQVRRKMLNCMT